MTDAQIRYRALEETKFHNRMMESQTAAQLAETERANRARESISEEQIATQAATSRYATDVQAETARYAADTSAAVSRYATNINAETSLYRTNVESADRNARLEFDKATQSFQNDLAARRLRLDELQTNANVAYASSQIKRLVNQTRMDLVRLANDATRLDMDQEASRINNVLKKWQAFETATKGIANVTSLVGKLADLFKDSEEVYKP